MPDWFTGSTNWRCEMNTPYANHDRIRIISALQSARDRMARELPKKYGDGWDGDLDTLMDAINYMKKLAISAAVKP